MVAKGGGGENEWGDGEDERASGAGWGGNGWGEGVVEGWCSDVGRTRGPYGGYVEDIQGVSEVVHCVG